MATLAHCISQEYGDANQKLEILAGLARRLAPFRNTEKFAKMCDLMPAAVARTRADSAKELISDDEFVRWTDLLERDFGRAAYRAIYDQAFVSATLATRVLADTFAHVVTLSVEIRPQDGLADVHCYGALLCAETCLQVLRNNADDGVLRVSHAPLVLECDDEYVIALLQDPRDIYRRQELIPNITYAELDERAAYVLTSLKEIAKRVKNEHSGRLARRLNAGQPLYAPVVRTLTDAALGWKLFVLVVLLLAIFLPDC